jgi:hypothetical protein
MRQLSAEGRTILEGVAQRHNFSFDAVSTMLMALDWGNGSQAQFNHFEFGGMGQWSQGGMIMIGDMFNNGLKYRVDQLCSELSDLLRSQPLFQPEPATTYASGGNSWWPADLGHPSSSGGQNDMQYAFFPNARRLAVRQNGQVSLYDTGNHMIGGVSQSQSGSAQDLSFTSQFGTVRLYDLGLIVGSGTPAQPVAPFGATHERQPVSAPATPVQAKSAPADEADIFAKIERLHGLQLKGILSEAEFAAKKKDLLDRL